MRVVDHEKYMRRCLELARKGKGRVLSNPMVGCVIVNRNEIIGEGYHAIYGEAHAEVNAIRSVKDASLLSESTLYVNLEPCSHHGKTPPCADLIVEKGIPKVFIAQKDPNPQVAGKGIERLRSAGIQVEAGLLEREATELNRRFNTFHLKQRPYVVLKWAMSQNGIMDIPRNEGQKGIYWLSAPATKKLVHKWRSEEMAILVGSRTIQVDDPRLDTRKYHGRNPLRVILSGKEQLPQNARVLMDDKPVLIFGEIEQKGNEVEWINTSGKNSIDLLFSELYRRSILSVLVEGGTHTLNRFIESENWDEARAIQSGTHLPEGLAAPKISGVMKEDFTYAGDRITIFRNA